MASKTLAERIEDRIVESILGNPDQLAALLNRPASSSRTVAEIREQYHNGAAETIQAAPRRRQRTRVARFVYQQTPRRKNAKVLELRPNDQQVYNAIDRKPMTARQIMESTGMKLKAVESSLWYLRNHDADGNRLGKRKVNTADALVNSVDAE